MESSLNKLQSDYSAGNGKVIPDRTLLYRRRCKQERKGIGLSLQEKELRGMNKISDCLLFLTKKRYYICKIKTMGILSVILINSLSLTNPFIKD